MDVRPVAALRLALPYLRLFRDRLFVIKCGGDALENRASLESLVEQIALLHHLGIRIVLVHGGGPQATALGERLGVESTFVDGRRVTSAETLETMVMALNGTARTSILSAARAVGLSAVGVSGIDAGIVTARQRPPVSTSAGTTDYGHVGDIVSVDPAPLQAILDAGSVPVLSPLCADSDGNVLNINADDVAARLAVELGAVKLVLVTSPRGILTDIDDPMSLISQVSVAQLDTLTQAGTIKSGMLPKTKAAKSALAGGVERVHILSYQFPDSLLTEVFTNEGCGTMVVAE